MLGFESSSHFQIHPKLLTKRGNPFKSSSLAAEPSAVKKARRLSSPSGEEKISSEEPMVSKHNHQSSPIDECATTYSQNDQEELSPFTQPGGFHSTPNNQFLSPSGPTLSSMGARSDSLFSSSFSLDQDPYSSNEFHQLLIEEAMRLVHAKFGNFLASPDQELNENTLFGVECANEHTFDTTLSMMRQGDWCKRCKVLMQKVQQFVHSKGWKFIETETLRDKIQIICNKGHYFEINAKETQKSYCLQCKLDAQNEFREYLRQEEERKSREYEEKQEQLYEEAKLNNQRSRYQQQSQQPYNYEKNKSQNKKEAVPDSEKIIYAAKIVENEVKLIAQKQANQFIQHQNKINSQHLDNCTESDSSKNNNNMCKLEQAFEVYRVMLFPEAVMQYYYDNLDAESLKNEFKYQMKVIHPDKNPHPKAGQAFQKVFKYYKMAARKMD